MSAWGSVGLLPLGQQLLDGEVGPEALHVVLQHVAPLLKQLLHLFLIHQAAGLELLAFLRVAVGTGAVFHEEHRGWLELEAPRATVSCLWASHSASPLPGTAPLIPRHPRKLAEHPP